MIDCPVASATVIQILGVVSVVGVVTGVETVGAAVAVLSVFNINPHV
ncbi:MAG: hypothetical protein WCG98_09495 [bacterium]